MVGEVLIGCDAKVLSNLRIVFDGILDNHAVWVVVWIEPDHVGAILPQFTYESLPIPLRHSLELL